MNWWKVLDKGIKAKLEGNNEPFGDDIVDKAGDWPTCAVGQLCKELPRYTEEEGYQYSDGEPKDEILAEFGSDFAEAIGDQDPLRAHYFMTKIEKRTITLLKKQPKRATKGR
jgi:hypothetical protein